jgi:glycosyltransferase involved in cell wall biosynthesis
MTRSVPRVVALIAAYNEARFIAGCLDNLARQGVAFYLIDNGSTDDTVALAERYAGRGLIGIETMPRAGVYSWRPILERKEELAATLDADWFINLDPDEIRLPPRAGQTLAEAFAAVEDQGYNAVNFQEFTFIPTREQPDHDHPDYLRTMRHYYPFGSGQNQIKAWRRPDGPVAFAFSGGHHVRFAGLKVSPENFVMKHYMFLSLEHARRKYIAKTYDADELQRGWHRLRAELRPETLRLPSEAELRSFISDDALDATNPRQRHFLFDTGGGSQ